ncbi:MAG: FlgD immunoglobulin-like domain containing protein [Bacteroidota bacterium]
MTRPLFLLLFSMAVAAPALAQFDAARAQDLRPVSGPQRNIVDNLDAEGDTLWAGQQLTFTADGGASWFLVDDDVLTPPIAPSAIVYSLDIEGPNIWVGLGFQDPAIASRPQSAAGFAHSEDGGQTWTYEFPQLDQPEDTLQVYGCNALTPEALETGALNPILGCDFLAPQLPALPVIVPQQSPPFDIDFDPTTGDVWVAGFASGIRRLSLLPDSNAYAPSFERIVLPPDTLDAISPTQPYFFPLAPEVNENEEALNFLGFSVLVDETGTVWAGTVAGVNRSRPEDVVELVVFDTTGTVPIDTLVERGWQRTSFDGTSQGLPGDWVIAIEEQPVGDETFAVGTPENPRNPVWLSVWRASEPSERFALVVTKDGGETFEPVLVGGRRFYDLAFCPDGATSGCTPGTVYAAGDDGLFISDDEGRTWRSVRDFRDRDVPGRFVSRDARVFAVAATPSALWVGTGDGLLKSEDGGVTWTVFRVDVPTSPAAPTERAPEVETYAYPNPFSPNADTFVRIRYDRPTARIRIFDFAMNLVRTISSATPNEQVWDGFDDSGNRVANGVYFYEVDAAGESLRGKILVLE